MSVPAARVEFLGRDVLSKRGYVFAWYRLSAKPLYELWVSLYPSQEEAIAHMLWFANVLTRDKAYSSRMKYESVRDEWLQTRSVGGKFLHLNPISCYKCKGKGFALEIRETGRSKKKKLTKIDCTQCDNGVHGMQSIYLHKVQVGRLDMLVQSSVKPTLILHDLPDYEDFDISNPSRLPMSALLRILSYHAVGELGMYWSKGRYRVKKNKGVSNGYSKTD